MMQWLQMCQGFSGNLPDKSQFLLMTISSLVRQQAAGWVRGLSTNHDECGN
jgi:hypothetical protein